MKVYKTVAPASYKFAVAIIQQLPQLNKIMMQVPAALDGAMRDPEIKATILNKSFLGALKKLSENPSLDKNKIIEKCKELIDLAKQGGNEAALAEEFWRSNIGSFIKWIWEITHLSPILKRLPEVTFGNAWKVIMNTYKTKSARVGVISLCMAVLEIVQYLGATALMTGLLGKVLILFHLTALGTAFAAGAWIAWGLVGLMRKEGEQSKIIAGLMKAIDPGTDLGLLDKFSQENQ